MPVIFCALIHLIRVLWMSNCSRRANVAYELSELSCDLFYVSNENHKSRFARRKAYHACAELFTVTTQEMNIFVNFFVLLRYGRVGIKFHKIRSEFEQRRDKNRRCLWHKKKTILLCFRRINFARKVKVRLVS